LDGETASVGHLYEMLEGQVAVLSSGLLSGAESLTLLESLRRSPLYRSDQNSYILYPDRPVQDFLEKNRMTPDQVGDLALVAELVQAQDTSLISVDVDGDYHFNGQIRNLKDVNRILDALGRKPRYEELVKSEGARIKALFEAVFHHDESLLAWLATRSERPGFRKGDGDQPAYDRDATSAMNSADVDAALELLAHSGL
jgi:hypothetical protein